MNKRIRSMIDEIFSEMKMTAENLALRDELMANAQARFEDAVFAGATEDEAFAAVAASLGDVQALLHEMNPQKDAQANEEIDMNAGGDEAAQDDDAQDAAYTAAPEDEQAQAEDVCDLDIGEMFNKAFAAMDDFGKRIVPQAKKFVRQMDDATGGILSDIGKSVEKGIREATKAAEEAFDTFADKQPGEVIFEHGGSQRNQPEKSPEELREEAKDLRAQASFKRVTGDAENARLMEEEAEALETQADAIEQAQAMEQAQQAAAQEEAPVEEEPAEEEQGPCALKEPLLGEDGEVNEDALTRAVDDMAREAENIVKGAEEMARKAAKMAGEAADDFVHEAEEMARKARKMAEDANTIHGDGFTVRDSNKPSGGHQTFPAAGLREVDIQLDADDVRMEAGEGHEIETIWTAQNVDGEPVVLMEGHRLVIRRKNPDVFKTFFSVFSKDGGRLIVRVPHGYAADYNVSTTSGDIHLYELDVDDVKISSTSGDVRLEPDASVRAKTVSVSTTVSACAEKVSVATVSGRQFVSCDADKVDVKTVSGKAHVEGACEEWEADSVSGDVHMLCTSVPSRKIRVSTMSASAHVALPEDIRGFTAEMSGVSGAISNEFGVNRYGTCSLPIRMDTVSGRLIITRL